MTERLDTQVEDWPVRPWLMAALAAVAGLAFHFLVHDVRGLDLSPSRQATAAFVAVATISFIVTIERNRWIWAAAFALAWGAVIAFVGWFTASYNIGGELTEFPFLSGVAAALIAAPLFQTVRDEGAWSFPYKRLHSHAWADAVIGAASLFFTGIAFLLAFLIAGLFDIIGIDMLKKLLREGWFNWTLAGFAFGGAFGMLRERDRLVGTLQRLVMVVLSVLAPVLAGALLLFLVSIPFTGLQKLWDGWLSAAGLLLTAAAGAVLLVNAVIGDGKDEKSGNKVLGWAALILVGVVLPLASLAGLAMAIRIGQYGWTPERIWGAIAVGVALAYGLAGWWSIWRGRNDFDALLRPLQTKLAIGICGLAVLLALPILDFGAISTRSQVDRLERGTVKPDQFDWAALAFDFGPTGRDSLARIARSGPAPWRKLAGDALSAKERWGIQAATNAAIDAEQVGSRVRVVSPDIELTPELRRRIARQRTCEERMQCLLMRAGDRQFVLVTRYPDGGHVSASLIDLAIPEEVSVARAVPPPPNVDDLDTARIEIRSVPKRQVFVNGQPVGEEFK